jgi:hypothetical protein
MKEDKTDNSRNKVSLELVQVDIEGAIKAEGRGDGRDDLRNQPVQVCEARLCDVEAILADIVDSFVVDLNTHHQRRNQTPKSHQKILAMNEQSACSSVVCVVSTELYGSTTEEDN